ncbi:LuxR C-terminal-related transcriptional regulator [Flavobacterium magnesitis]|uniref:LuxR C-terminal-related transcriptional regulator n=1 Tax=Flavobacterium magnesitis TaxID=3138077 RepID=UPI00358DE00F
MKNIFFSLFFLSLVSTITAQEKTNAPQPFGPLPSQKQIDWQEMEFYAFIHFSLNTFTNKEWGYGDESPELFNPTALDARQWARVAKEAGMKGIILVAKHHGLGSKQIAEELHIAVHTVYRHRQNIINKMKVANTAEAVKTAVVMGIISL